MKDNLDLIGKTYRNGEDGVARFRVTKVDSEFPSLIHAENIASKRRVCALADFVRHYLED